MEVNYSCSVVAGQWWVDILPFSQLGTGVFDERLSLGRKGRRVFP